MIEAATGSEAIAVLSTGTHVDLVFSDINLSEAMSGHALAGWLASNRPQVPMLLTSGDLGELGRVTVGTMPASSRSLTICPSWKGGSGKCCRIARSRRSGKDDHAR